MTWRAEDETGVAIAMMVAGLIDEHIDCQPGSDECEGCCPLCCAPCAGLAYLRDRLNEPLTLWFKLWNLKNLQDARKAYPDEDLIDWHGYYDWQNEDYSVNWALIEAHWKLTECHEGDEDAQVP